jgi:hypothetical protein
MIARNKPVADTDSATEPPPRGRNRRNVVRVLVSYRTFSHGWAFRPKARGVTFGRPKKMRPDQQELARELVRDGKSISAVARTFDVHPATIYRVIEG